MDKKWFKPRNRPEYSRELDHCSVNVLIYFIFCGMCILLSGLGQFLLIIWNRFWRHCNIRKWGYPPPHCDADGDFRNDDEEGEWND
jgi:hypothetical protein